MTDFDALSSEEPPHGEPLGVPLDAGDGQADERANEVVLTVSEFVALFATEPANSGDDDETYRSCDNPFCGCTSDKTRFLKLVGVVDDWGDLTRYGERVRYLWSTDPAASRTTPPLPGPSIVG